MLSARPVERLLERIRGQNAERDRNSRLHHDVLNTIRARAGNVLKMRGLAADHRAKTNDGITLPCTNDCQRSERKFKGTRHPGHLADDDAQRSELFLRARNEPRGNILVEPACNDRDAKSGRATGSGTGVSYVSLHGAQENRRRRITSTTDIGTVYDPNTAPSFFFPPWKSEPPLSSRKYWSASLR